jgi:nucleotide sugar dehydrogenase
LKPDRIVIGAWNQQDFEIMRRIYQRFYNSPTVKYIEVNPKEAAAGKLLANFLLFTRLVSVYDVVGRVAESFDDIHFENLRQILTTDERIGKWGFYDSLYAGGSCLIKDAKSLKKQLSETGANTEQVQRVLSGNVFQRDNFFACAQKEAKFDWQNKKIAILGLAFKRDTNDIRNSAAIDAVEFLLDKGVEEIRVYDPAAMDMFQNNFDPNKEQRFAKIKYFDNEKAALENSQACLILTDWAKFRSLGEIIKNVCPTPYLIMDGRRMLTDQFEELNNLGYDVIAVGSPMRKRK